MALDRQLINEVAQIGFEVTAGTAIAATRRLNTIKMMIGSNLETNEYKGAGSRWDSEVVINRERSDISIDQSVLTYDEFAIAVAMLFGQPTITTPGGGTLSRDLDWAPSTYNPIVAATTTIEVGSSTYAERVAGAQLSGLSCEWGNDGCTFTADGFARLLSPGVQLTKNATYTLTSAASPPTAGTYTLTVNGATTAAIAFGANPAAVQAALELLSTVGAGNVIVTLLANGPTTATASTTYTIEFRGALAGTAVTGTGTFTGLTPSGSISVPAGIVGSTPAQLDIVAVQPVHWNIYVDDTAAGLGTTQLLTPHAGSFSLGDLFAPYYVLDRAQTSYKSAVEGDASGELSLTLQANAAGYAFLTAARAGQTRFIRAEAVGPLIEGALFYRMRFDFACKLTSIAKGDDQGVTTVDLTAAIKHDKTWNKALAISLRNTLTAL